MPQSKKRREKSQINSAVSSWPDQYLTDRLIQATDLGIENMTGEKICSRSEDRMSSRKTPSVDESIDICKKDSRGSIPESPSRPLYTEFNDLLSKLFQRYKGLSNTSISTSINPPEFLVSPSSSNSGEKPLNYECTSDDDLASGDLKIKESLSFMKDLLYPPLTYGVPPTRDRNFVVANVRVTINSPILSPRGNPCTQGKKVTIDSKSTARTALTGRTATRAGTVKSGSRSERKSRKNLPVIQYQLSNLENVMRGFTAPPNNIAFTKLYSFLAEPSKQQWDGFRPREAEKTQYYNDGSLAVRIEKDGTGKIFYPNGELAIVLADSRIGRRMLILSLREKDSAGYMKDVVPIALFDQKGNGVVYDIHGKIRLNYDQAEGALYDSGHGLPVKWKWAGSGPVFQRRKELELVAEDPDDWEPEPWDNVKDERRKLNQKKLAKRTTPLRSPCSVPLQHTTRGSRLSSQKTDPKLKPRILPKFGPPPKKTAVTCPKLIVLKLNRFIALRLINQGHIHIDFKCQKIHLSLNVGVKVSPEELDRIDKGVITEEHSFPPPCYFESAFMRTRSLRVLNKAFEGIRKHASILASNGLIQEARLWGYPDEKRKCKINKTKLKYQLLKKQGGKLSQ